MCNPGEQYRYYTHISYVIHVSYIRFSVLVCTIYRTSRSLTGGEDEKDTGGRGGKNRGFFFNPETSNEMAAMATDKSVLGVRAIFCFVGRTSMLCITYIHS